MTKKYVTQLSYEITGCPTKVLPSPIVRFFVLQLKPN